LLSITIDTSTPPSLAFIHILGFLEGEARGGEGDGEEEEEEEEERAGRRGEKKISCGLQFPTKVAVKTIS
jgi:hypothetical protein